MWMAIGWFLMACGRDSSPETTGEDTCIDRAPAADVAEGQALVDGTAASYQEIMECGGLAVQLSNFVLTVFVNTLLGTADVSKAPFTYEGGGQYQTGDDDTTMVVQFVLGEDLSLLGPAGTVVPHDLFDIENYLVDASIELDVFAQSLVVSYDAPGPLVELMGYGATPDSPLEIGLGEVFSVGLPLQGLLLDAWVLQSEDQGERVVQYEIESAPRRLGDIYADRRLTWELVAAQTTATDGGTLTPTSWSLTYLDRSATLDGVVAFEIRGASLDLDGSLTYVDSVEPEVALTCP